MGKEEKKQKMFEKLKSKFKRDPTDAEVENALKEKKEKKKEKKGGGGESPAAPMASPAAAAAPAKSKAPAKAPAAASTPAASSSKKRKADETTPKTPTSAKKPGPSNALKAGADALGKITKATSGALAESAAAVAGLAKAAARLGQAGRPKEAAFKTMWEAHRESAVALVGSSKGMDQALEAFGEAEWPKKARETFAARTRKKLRLATSLADKVYAKAEAKASAGKPKSAIKKKKKKPKKKRKKKAMVADEAVVAEAYEILASKGDNLWAAADGKGKGTLSVNHLKHLCLHRGVFQGLAPQPGQLKMIRVLLEDAGTNGGKLERGPAPAPVEEEEDSEDSEEEDEDDEEEEPEDKPDDEEDEVEEVDEEAEAEEEGKLSFGALLTKRYITTASDSLGLNALQLRAMLKGGEPMEEDWAALGMTVPEEPKSGRKRRRSRGGKGLKTPESGGGPKRSRTAYTIFVSKFFSETKPAEGEPGVKIQQKERMKAAGARWKELSVEEKQPFVEQAQAEKEALTAVLAVD